MSTADGQARERAEALGARVPALERENYDLRQQVARLQRALGRYAERITELEEQLHQELP